MIHFHKKSIVSRLSFYIACTSLLTISIVIIFFVSILRDATIRWGKEHVSTTLDEQVQRITVSMNRNIYAAQMLAMAVQTTWQGDAFAKKKLERLAMHKMSELPAIMSMGFEAISGAEPKRSIRLIRKGADIPETLFFSPAALETSRQASSPASLSKPFHIRIDGQPVLAVNYTVPVFEDGAVLGFVHTVISLVDIQHLLSQVRPFGGGYLALYSTDSTYIYYPQQDRIGKRMAERPGNAERAQALLEGKVFERNNFNNSVVHEASYSILKPLRFDTLPDPWGMQTTISLPYILQKTQTQTYQAVAIGFVGLFALLCGFVLFMLWFIQKPLRQIEGCAEALSQGIFTRRLDITSNDEIGNTARSMNLALDAITQKTFWYEALLHALPNPLVASDLNHQRTFANKAAQSLVLCDETGAPAEAASLPDLTAVNPETGAQTVFYAMPDGTTYSVRMTLLQNTEEENTGYVKVATDVTEIILLKSKAEMASRSKSDFLARMSHEIRTPMNAIIGMTFLAMENACNDRQKNYLQKIAAAAKSLLVIINDILDFSKIEAGKFVVENKHFLLSNTLQLLEEIILVRCKEKGLTFSLERQPDMPNVLYGPGERLLQVLINLCGNAVKFTNAGGNVTLTLRAEPAPGDMIRLECHVRDTGLGIPLDKQANIFNPFEQVEGASTRKAGGTGLGLAISKDLVHLMQGELWFESTPGKGSTFSFYILLNYGDPQQITMEEDASCDLDELREVRILLAEDNEINQEIANELLSSRGASVCIANNGREAVELFGQYIFDVVLMDIAMPEMDGLMATRTIRASTMPGAQTVPIIAMTAHALVGDKEKSLDAGMNDHITKPIDIQEVMSKVRFWVCHCS